MYLMAENSPVIKQGMLEETTRNPISLILIPNEKKTAISGLSTNYRLKIQLSDHSVTCKVDSTE